MQEVRLDDIAIDSQEKADELVVTLHNKVEQLKSCLNSLENCLQQTTPAEAALSLRLSHNLEILNETIQRLFVRVQSFEGELLDKKQYTDNTVLALV